MARMVVIPDGGDVVVNVIEAGDGFTLPGFFLVQSDIAGTGWTYSGGQFTPPAPPSPVVPDSVAGWRGRTVMVLHGLDPSIKGVIAGMSDPQKTIASMGYESADTFLRAGVLLNTILKGLGKTDADIDGYFIEAAALPS